MTIIEDTRNQIGKHDTLNAQLKEMGHKIVRSKLFTGDYTNIYNQRVCIDTKKDIVEISGNICGEQHERFREECIRAKESGIQLIVLIEEVPPNGKLNEWESPKHKNGKPFTKVKGETLLKSMITMKQKYGVRFMFCEKEQTARLIVKLLEE